MNKEKKVSNTNISIVSVAVVLEIESPEMGRDVPVGDGQVALPAPQHPHLAVPRAVGQLLAPHLP